jgi:hypothetical protein
MSRRKILALIIACTLFSAHILLRTVPAQNRTRVDLPHQWPTPAGMLRIAGTGYTKHGEWSTAATVSQSLWEPGMPVQVQATLLVSDTHLAGLVAAGIKAETFCMLVTAERTFDAEGHIRLSGAHRGCRDRKSVV